MKTWHVDEQTLEGYLADELALAAAASIEAHLLSCGQCRAALALKTRRGSTGARHEETWIAIADRIDAPGFGAVERAVIRFGVSPHVARLLAATPALRRAWWLCAVSLLGLSVLMAQIGNGVAGTVAFVVGAPLVPLVGVTLAFGVHGEPVHEIALVTPLRSFRLIVLRTLAILASVLPVAALLSPMLPGHPMVWLLPAFALCALVLAFATLVDPFHAAAVLGAAWVIGAIASMRGVRFVAPDAVIEHYALFRPEGQAVLAGVSVLATIYVFVRRSSFEIEEPSW